MSTSKAGHTSAAILTAIEESQATMIKGTGTLTRKEYMGLCTTDKAMVSFDYPCQVKLKSVVNQQDSSFSI